MTTPLKGLFGVMFKSLSQLRISTGRRQTSWPFTKCGEFGITTGTNSFSSPSRRFQPGSSAFKSPTLTTEPHCLLQVDVLVS